MGARDHHYLFAHKVFPDLIWKGNSILGILANPDNQEFTVNLWNDIGKRLEPTGRLPPDGLRHSSHWIGGEHLVILVELPEAEIPPEAQYVAIITSPQIRYLTLEKYTEPEEMPERYVLAEWENNGCHSSYDLWSEPAADAFLRSICRFLLLPETIEPPTQQQLQGMTRGRHNIDMTLPEGLMAADEQQLTKWQEAAEIACHKKDLGQAEQLYRQILDLRMSKQGPQNTKATLAHADLAVVLSFQDKHQGAETLCRDWWKLCRRFRMLGHAETMAATKTLAECLRDQGKLKEASELMNYRVLLSGLSRGADSIVADRVKTERTLFERNSA